MTIPMIIVWVIFTYFAIWMSILANTYSWREVGKLLYCFVCFVCVKIKKIIKREEGWVGCQVE